MMMERPRDYGYGAAMMPPIITTGETPMVPLPGENDSDLPARTLAKRGALQSPGAINVLNGERMGLASSPSPVYFHIDSTGYSRLLCEVPELGSYSQCELLLDG